MWEETIIKWMSKKPKELFKNTAPTHTHARMHTYTRAHVYTHTHPHPHTHTHDEVVKLSFVSCHCNDRRSQGSPVDISTITHVTPRPLLGDPLLLMLISLCLSLYRDCIFLYFLKLRHMVVRGSILLFVLREISCLVHSFPGGKWEEKDWDLNMIPGPPDLRRPSWEDSQLLSHKDYVRQLPILEVLPIKK